MKRLIGLLLIVLVYSTTTHVHAFDMDKAFKEAKKIEKEIKRTKFPKRTFSIVDFGAKPNQQDAPCHEAINQAITECSLAGGGMVVVPAGVFYTGPITITSNVNLHIAEGAVLKFLP